MDLIFDDPAALPHRSQPKPEFDKKMGNYYRDLPVYGAQLKALISSVQALAAGGAYAFPYVFDSSTADSDPGLGKLRLSNTTQTGSATLRMDVQIVGGVDISNVFADLRAATSAVKGSIRLVKMTDPTKWAIFDVSAVALPVGYRNLSVVARASSTVNPFINGDALMVYIERNGDSGTVPGSLELMGKITVSTAVASISFPSIFDNSHDWYFIQINGISFNQDTSASVKVAVGGVVDQSANYFLSPASSSTSLSNNSFINGSSTHNEMGGVLQIGNSNASRGSPIIFDGYLRKASSVQASALRGMYAGTGILSGFELRTAAGLFTGGSIAVYGVRNS